jgi:hypothetical protein
LREKNEGVILFPAFFFKKKFNITDYSIICRRGGGLEKNRSETKPRENRMFASLSSFFPKKNFLHRNHEKRGKKIKSQSQKIHILATRLKLQTRVQDINIIQRVSGRRRRGINHLLSFFH